MMTKALIAALVAALLGLGVQTYRLAGVRSELAEATTTLAEMSVAVAQANAKAAQQAAEFSNKVIEAQNEAKQREARLRAAAAAAGNESDSLRHDLDQVRDQLATATRDAAVERAAAVSAVLADCSRKYQGMAAKADAHASDVRTLMDAWPK
jgi:uncharacterized protein YgfB (UPF0149 family)